MWSIYLPTIRHCLHLLGCMQWYRNVVISSRKVGQSFTNSHWATWELVPTLSTDCLLVSHVTVCLPIIKWGIIQGEWIMHFLSIQDKSSNRLLPASTPTHLDAWAWAKLKYIRAYSKSNIANQIVRLALWTTCSRKENMHHLTQFFHS